MIHGDGMPVLAAALRALDVRFNDLQIEARIPGLAWGVVAGNRLIHWGGAGTIRDGEVHRPDADSVYRIASMTKSFTAATLILLRNEGRVVLDEPVATYVPELAAWRPPTSDSGPVTVRQLMTMSAGLPADDDWGDRQLGLDPVRFAALLADGPRFAWPPGTTYEYSNFGYAILGRVIANVDGREYRDVVRDRLLAPLGMKSTTYLESEVDPDHLAHGYVRRNEIHVREGTDGYGAFASMGGLFSTVRDLSRWVAGFLDAFPARDDPDSEYPLHRASRREMQQVQRAYGPMIDAHDPDVEPAIFAGGYGFGLHVLRDPELGTWIRHAGGYPGFGSSMAWHPATGLGVIGLGNLRYAPLRPVVGETLAALVRAEIAPRRRITAMPSVSDLRQVVNGLIERWDDAVADAVFADNMDLDEPRTLRRAALATMVDELGPFRPDASRPATSDSPTDLTWWLRGAHGWVRVSIVLTPEPSPRLQRLVLLAVGDPSSAILEIAARIIGIANVPDPVWPDDLPVGSALDRDAVVHSLGTVGGLLGSLSLGRPNSGDGRTSTTFELRGDRGRADLKISLEAATGAVSAASVRISARGPEPEAW